MTRFIHAGDIHLGNEQYGIPERTEDFNRAFMRMVDHAVADNVDFVLLTGDLLHKASQSDALALLHASVGLERLRKAGIPVVAIEGNHELQQRSDTVSFPKYLNLVSLVHLLDVQLDHYGRQVLMPWDSGAGSGSFIDLGPTRIFGMRYLGAQTARIIEEVAGQIDRGNAEFVIMMLHAGMEGEIPHMHGGLTMGQLAPLRGQIDYVALGHVHKKLECEGWIFNPGSTEVCGMDEIGEDWPHGFFEVVVAGGHAKVEHHSTASRAFCRLDVDVSQCDSPQSVLETAQKVIGDSKSLSDGAVVEITLMGVTQFNRHHIPEELIKAAVEARCHPLTVRVRYSASQIAVGLDRSQRGTRAELEREVIEDIVRQNPAYRRHATEWAQMALDVKQMVHDGRPPGAIAEHVQVVRAKLGTDVSAEPAPEPTEAAPTQGQLELTEELTESTETESVVAGS